MSLSSGEKPFSQSFTVRAILISLLGALASYVKLHWHYEIGPEDIQNTVDNLLVVVTVGANLMALYGRVKATKTVAAPTLPKTDGA
jgi:hypothetical protein